MERFLFNKYHVWYFNIISKKRTFTKDQHKHHIIPRSLGGSNEDSNIVRLSKREHFICHLLLCKMTEGSDKYKMIHAANLMRGLSSNSRTYQTITQLMSDSRKLIPRSKETKMKISKSHKGKILSETTKQKISIGISKKIVSNPIWLKLKNEKSAKSRTGYKHTALAKTNMSKAIRPEHSDATKNKMSLSHIGILHSLETKLNLSKLLTGHTTSEETKSKIALKLKTQRKYTCKYCSILATSANIHRWHNENCKSLKV
jgi:hypothetical protein